MGVKLSREKPVPHLHECIAWTICNLQQYTFMIG
jgi:flavin reductase (DIM6/NTAB) family NADH-FMN oxidoreductase RutF